jgi:hypothetical protein
MMCLEDSSYAHVANTVGLPLYGVSVFEECGRICRRIRTYADMCVLRYSICIRLWLLSSTRNNRHIMNIQTQVLTKMVGFEF